jgi:hypothetical protein
MPVQVAPVNGMVVNDFNGDGNLDVLMVGNNFGNEVFAGRYDAFTGLVLLGDGKGGFRVVNSDESGFNVGGDAKGLARVVRPSGDVYVATQNRDSVRVFTAPLSGGQKLTPGPLEFAADLVFPDGRKQRVEFYYGSGYLSQSSRSVTVPTNLEKVILYDSKGQKRTAPRPNL